jgi:hypothetical protein
MIRPYNCTHIVKDANGSICSLRVYCDSIGLKYSTVISRVQRHKRRTGETLIFPLLPDSTHQILFVRDNYPRELKAIQI